MLTNQNTFKSHVKMVAAPYQNESDPNAYSMNIP